MAGKGAEWAMIVLGVLSAALLVAYGAATVSDLGGTGLVFWLFVVLFLMYIGWDIARHLRSMQSRSSTAERRLP